MKMKTIAFASIITSLVIFKADISHAAAMAHIVQKAKVELRLAQDVPDEHSQTMEVFGSKRKVFVEAKTYFSNSDIETARAELTEDTVIKEPVLILKLTADGSTRFAKFTTDNYNKAVAIIIDDKVMSTPIIRETITSWLIYFTGKFTIDEAEAIAARINGK
jgi:preprotein translocase subunit SecD